MVDPRPAAAMCLGDPKTDDSVSRASCCALPVPHAYASVIRHGYDLQLSGGPRLDRHDPLLTAFGANVAELEQAEEEGEDLQHAVRSRRDLHMSIDAESTAPAW